MCCFAWARASSEWLTIRRYTCARAQKRPLASLHQVVRTASLVHTQSLRPDLLARLLFLLPLSLLSSPTEIAASKRHMQEHLALRRLLDDLLHELRLDGIRLCRLEA